MTVPRGAYCRLLVPSAASRGGWQARGNDLFDILSASRGGHSNVSNLVFWEQPGLSCYTPTPEYRAAHCLLAQPAGADYGHPDLTGSPYPVVKWRRTQGAVSALAVLPDGTPPVCSLQICDDDAPSASAGLPWAFETADLGAWAGDAGAGTGVPGVFGLNRGVAVTLKLGQSDADAPPTSDGLTDGVPPGRDASDGSAPGDVRIAVGQWSVLFPSGGSPAFEKKFRHRDPDGVLHEWLRLHTFTGAAPQGGPGGPGAWLVTLACFSGRLLVSVGGKSLAAEAYSYGEPVSAAAPGLLKTLSLGPAPLRVTGRAGGGPRWIGLRRLSWGAGGFTGRLVVTDASLAPASFPGPPRSGKLTLIKSVPALGGGDAAGTLRMTAPTTLLYDVAITSSAGGQEPCAVKWALFGSPSQFAGGGAGGVDYAPAVRRYTLRLPEPDFAGTGNVFGSRATCEMTFDTYELDLIAAQAGTDWRVDLGAYGPATFLTGRDVDDGTGTGNVPGAYLTEEATRIQGYFEKPDVDLRGFQDQTLTLTLSDASVLLHLPAGFIDQGFAPLDFLQPNILGLYGADAVRYILAKCISPAVGAALRVYMPTDWYPLAPIKVLGLTTGQLPSQDKPLFTPPYGKYADEWLAEIEGFDCAAFFWAGQVPIYGQFDLIAPHLPGHDAWMGDVAPSGSGAVPAGQGGWIVSHLEARMDTAVDFNDVVLWGRPLGAGDDSQALGVPIVAGRAVDRGSVQRSWRRTKLLEGAMFYDPAVAQRNADTFLRLLGAGKAARHYSAGLPFPQPALGWGHRMTFHGGGPDFDGKTLRIVDLTEEGDMVAGKADTRLELVEMI